jgi:hypothetical protein
VIKFENTEVFNFEGAFRGMRNPLNSWDKSDSYENYEKDNYPWVMEDYIIGENDLKLAQNLIKAGSDHRKFMRQILVSVDIIAPLYWWKEFDTYKVATVSNSCSTMHTIHKKEFTLDDFSTDKMSSYARDILEDFIFSLNTYRKNYLESNDKTDWYDIIQSLPSSFNQRRTITLNYETLRNIYGSRRNHKLDEWSVGFMSWIDSLPYSDELIKYS